MCTNTKRTKVPHVKYICQNTKQYYKNIDYL